MPEPRPTISTHVLDTGRGTPATGIRVRLWRLGQDDAGDGRPTGAATGRPTGRPTGEALTERLVGEALTDADGRIRDLLAGAPLEAGQYRLEFDLEPAAGSPDPRGGEPGAEVTGSDESDAGGGGFFTGMSVGLRIDDPTRSYHVPLLRAPFGLSTYRGS